MLCGLILAQGVVTVFPGTGHGAPGGPEALSGSDPKQIPYLPAICWPGLFPPGSSCLHLDCKPLKGREQVLYCSVPLVAPPSVLGIQQVLNKCFLVILLVLLPSWLICLVIGKKQRAVPLVGFPILTVKFKNGESLTDH